MRIRLQSRSEYHFTVTPPPNLTTAPVGVSRITHDHIGFSIRPRDSVQSTCGYKKLAWTVFKQIDSLHSLLRSTTCVRIEQRISPTIPSSKFAICDPLYSTVTESLVLYFDKHWAIFDHNGSTKAEQGGKASSRRAIGRTSRRCPNPNGAASRGGGSKRT